MMGSRVHLILTPTHPTGKQGTALLGQNYWFEQVDICCDITIALAGTWLLDGKACRYRSSNSRAANYNNPRPLGPYPIFLHTLAER
jgi:hypothetical protein